MDRYNYIAIEGNIGAGKTTLAKKIASDFNAKLILEQFDDNPFLPKFYKDPDKNSFPLELSFLAERYQQLKDQASNQDLFKAFTISDYIFDKCYIFAKNNLASDEFTLYSKLFTIINPLIPKPDLLVYLYLHVEKSMNNIAIRGRTYEQEISHKYLDNVQNGYLEYLKQMQNQRILFIDINNVDFVNNHTTYLSLLEAMNMEYSYGINRVYYTKDGLFTKDLT